MAASSSYSKLPAELMSRVAELVHEQDLAFAKLLDEPFAQARSPAPLRRGVGTCEVELGEWSYFYGRGIKAMAQVDRRTQAAALPHLYKNITSKQTHKPYFRYEVLGEGLAQHVRHLQVTDHDSVLLERAESIACALRKLPNLSSLRLGPCILIKLGDPQPGVAASEGDDMLRGALQVTLGKVTSLTINNSEDDLLLDALRCVSATRLRRLRLSSPQWDAPLGDDLQGVLRNLVNVVELELNSLSDFTLVVMRRDLRLPSVRSVFLDTGLSYREDLALAHVIAPSITRLTHCNPMPAVEVGKVNIELPSPLLPTLRALVLDVDFYRSDFHQIALPNLEHYHFLHRSDCTAFPFDEVPFKSPSLRTVTVSLWAFHHGEPPTAFQHTCAAADIRLVVHRHPISDEELTDASAFADEPHSSPPSGTRRAALLKHLFDWAGRRAQWLCDVEDVAGLQELADAATRLQQRFVLDDS